MALFCRGGQPAPDHWKMSVTAPVGFPSRPSLAVEMVWTQGILLCLCFLTPSVAQSLQVLEMSLMPGAFDDQYIGCTEKMEKDAPRLMEEEMKKNRNLSVEWNKSEEKWNSMKKSLDKNLPRDFKDEYGRAIIAYTSTALSKVLNDAVRESATSLATYNSNFHFKAFHYYLTRALQLLRKSCDVTYKTPVYRGISDIRCEKKQFEIMRFGYFSSSSFNKIVAEHFRKDTGCLFTIHTCFGVDIMQYSYSKEQEEVLIPIHEKFQVFPGRDGSNSLVLQSTNQTCSHFNCACLGNERKDSCENNTVSQGTTFHLQMRPSLFGGSILLVNAAALKLFAAS
ncbi:ecto-ADP-ribosyltransferase 5-like [Alligator mississippiensis]|uniref:NAD(P)(+)--arginine ADP-ribosyltransferase n=1 Tax=Alligator mississippiensis TaxID=8496 RepID=A0A151PJ73_ALLMI|nr:ecto-ADP-ribosyltransferase 5-like [Alligator mississippiensis]